MTILQADSTPIAFDRRRRYRVRLVLAGAFAAVPLALMSPVEPAAEASAQASCPRLRGTAAKFFSGAKACRLGAREAVKKKPNLNRVVSGSARSRPQRKATRPRARVSKPRQQPRAKTRRNSVQRAVPRARVKVSPQGVQADVKAGQLGNAGNKSLPSGKDSKKATAETTKRSGTKTATSPSPPATTPSTAAPGYAALAPRQGQEEKPAQESKKRQPSAIWESPAASLEPLGTQFSSGVLFAALVMFAALVLTRVLRLAPSPGGPGWLRGPSGRPRHRPAGRVQRRPALMPLAAPGGQRRRTSRRAITPPSGTATAEPGTAGREPEDPDLAGAGSAAQAPAPVAGQPPVAEAGAGSRVRVRSVAADTVMIHTFGRCFFDGPAGRVSSSGKDFWDLTGLLLEHERGLPRQLAYELLWPGADPGRDRECFHNPMREIRARLCEALGARGVRGSDVIQNEPTLGYRYNSGMISADRWAFRDAAARAETATEAGERHAALRFAAELYRGPYLPSASGTWVQPVAETLRREAIGILTKIAGAETDPEQALRWLERATETDGCNEDLQCRKMRLNHRLGRTSAIHTAYDQLCAELRRLDRNLKPAPQTTHLYRRLTGRGT